MYCIIFCVLCSVFGRVMTCREDHLTIYYRSGDEIQLEISQQDIPENALTYQVVGLECPLDGYIERVSYDEKIMLPITYATTKDVTKFLTIFTHRPGRNICAYYIKISFGTSTKSILLCKLSDQSKHDYDTRSTDKTGKTHKHGITLSWREFCVTEVRDQNNVKGTGVATTGVQSAKMKLIIKSLMIFDNNTEIECNVASEKYFVIVNVVPKNGVEIKPFYTQEYIENDVYTFPCETEYKDILYWVSYDENNILIHAGSNSSSPLRQPFEMTQDNRISRLVCMIIDCSSGHLIVNCERKILNDVRLKRRYKQEVPNTETGTSVTSNIPPISEAEDSDSNVVVITVSIIIVMIIFVVFISWRCVKRKRSIATRNDNIYDTARVQYAELELKEVNKGLPRKEEAMYTEIAGILTPRTS